MKLTTKKNNLETAQMKDLVELKDISTNHKIGKLW